MSKIDLAPYLCPVSMTRTVFVVGTWYTGAQRCQVQSSVQGVFQCKNAEWEHLGYDERYIYRGMDTSPGGERVYAQYEGERYGAPWAARYMAVGETFVRSPVVRWFDKRTGKEVSPPQRVTDRLTLVAHHDRWQDPRSSVTLEDVIELAWETFERYYYARGLGLVGWVGKINDQPAESWTDGIGVVGQIERERVPWFVMPKLPPTFADSPAPQPAPVAAGGTVTPSLPLVDDARWKKQRVVESWASGVNVRGAPSTTNAPLLMVNNGDVVYTLAEAASGVWIPIKAGGVIGWISTAVASFVDVVEQPPPPPTTPEDLFVDLPEIWFQSAEVRAGVALVLEKVAESVRSARVLVP